MKTIILDDEQLAIQSLTRLLRRIDPDGSHEGVRYAKDFLRYIEENAVDVAFVDVDLYDTDGITLTRQLANIRPELNVVIYTGHPEFKADAMDLFVSGYLVKPASEEDLRRVLSHLRYPLKPVRVQCFGHFEVYVGNHPLKFERKDSKEVFAYLIDRRGAEVSDDELRYLLWSEEEDTDKKRNYIHNIIYDIRNTFAACGIREIINSRRGFYSVDTASLRCDYFDYLEGKDVPTAKLCEYMEQFSAWSAATKRKLFGRETLLSK